jgi:hypothetical protein
MRRIEVAIEDHAYDLEDNSELCKRIMAMAVPSEIAGAPGYMIDERGKVYRTWKRGSLGALDMLDDPEEVQAEEPGKVHGRRSRNHPLGLVTVEQPLRGVIKKRSVYALMVQMQHPAAGRFIKVTPLREKPEAKYDILVQMSREEPVPEPEQSVRMLTKNLHNPRMWAGLPSADIYFPNHAVDSRGYVWRVTARLPMGPGQRREGVPRDGRAEMLPSEKWVRAALRAKEQEGMATRFVVQIRPSGAKGVNQKVVDVMKLVQAYHGWEASMQAYRQLMGIYDPLIVQPMGKGGGKLRARDKSLGQLNVGPKLAAKLDEMGEREPEPPRYPEPEEEGEEEVDDGDGA